MAIKPIITNQRYNQIHSTVSLILGEGTGQFGYGQVLSSEAVLNIDKIVESVDMQKLRSDINRISRHQSFNNSNLDFPVVEIPITNILKDVDRLVIETQKKHLLKEGQVVVIKSVLGMTAANQGSINGQYFAKLILKSNPQSSEDFETNIFTIVDFNNNLIDPSLFSDYQSGGSVESNLILEQLYDEYETVANNLITTKDLAHPFQMSTERVLSSKRSTSWGGVGEAQSIFHEFTVKFKNANHRRHFFNTGGEIHFKADMTAPTNLKNNSWKLSIFDDMGTIIFSSNKTEATGNGTNTAIGNFNITNEYQTIFVKVPKVTIYNNNVYSGNIYNSNFYKISAKGEQNTNSIDFRIEMFDGVANEFDESVTGEIESIIVQKRATGNRPDDVIIESPTYFNLQQLSSSQVVPPVINSCDPTQGVVGVGRGIYTYTLNFGSFVGICGIEYNGYANIPDNFTITWNNQTVSTGLVTGRGTLTFNKTLSTPTTATLIVDADRSGTRFDWKIICPQISP